jgi:antitoxin HigA-1
MKRRPTHPGITIWEDYLEPLKISVTEMASKLEVSRKTLSKILNEKGAVTPDMALRLSRVFGTTPGLWLNLQKNSSSDWKSVRPFSEDILHPEL